MDLEILDLINAETRGISCRHQPFLQKFNNSKSSKLYVRVKYIFNLCVVGSLHLECDLTSPTGCMRCRPALATICCDIHEPRLALLYKSAVVKTPHQPCRSRLPTVKDMSDEDKEMQERKDAALRLDLEVWRRDQAMKEFGKGHARNLGPSIIMGLSTRERIVHCARYAKIKTANQLERETKWMRAKEFGPEIVQIIDKHYPANPLPTVIERIMPLTYQNTQPASQRTDVNGSVLYPIKRQVTCSACHKQGHISSCSNTL
ncbi:hypothetical protein M378DRAFT_91347 [Amanita muscaria Koide BX008]|uniref:Uncharacterized protein n=1 Tax=Amanita muscaria (strain Koide BX008) TaxID=946122 RepID=A0A0C2RXW5_AMAMK|nr:hypothetical protein M378DRAFT_91347 [Amanita muscaria Koide BX008]